MQKAPAKSNLRGRGGSPRKRLRISFSGDVSADSRIRSGGRLCAEGPPAESLPAWMRLGREYKGFCYIGKRPADAQAQHPQPPIPRIPYSSISPRQFFEEFVSPRRPCILQVSPADVAAGAPAESLRALFMQWGQWPYLRRKAGSTTVRVERRLPGESSYGKGRHETMTLSALLRALDAGVDSLYMTTQKQLNDAHGFLTFGGDLLDDSPISNDFPLLPPILSPPEQAAAGGVPCRPALYQYNFWLGSAREGVTSGLHHDFHDNLYCVIKGTKIFRLFSPRCAEGLPLKGTIAKIHDNGLICYSDDIRSDGASLQAVHEWRQTQVEAELRVLKARVALVARECQALRNMPKKSKHFADFLKSREESLALLMNYIEAAKARIAAVPDEKKDGEDKAASPPGAAAAEDFFDQSGSTDSDEAATTTPTTTSLDALLGSMSQEQRETLAAQREQLLRKIRECSAMNEETASTESDDAEDDRHGEGSTPEHFCEKNTENFAGSSSSSSGGNGYSDRNEYLDAFPENMLQDGFLQVSLGPGDMLWLPAGWFHEVISISGGGGLFPSKGKGHAAFNFWTYPRRLGGCWNESAYPDGFWPKRADTIRERLAFLSEFFGLAQPGALRPGLRALILKYGPKMLQEPMVVTGEEEEEEEEEDEVEEGDENDSAPGESGAPFELSDFEIVHPTLSDGEAAVEDEDEDCEEEEEEEEEGDANAVDGAAAAAACAAAALSSPPAKKVLRASKRAAARGGRAVKRRPERVLGPLKKRRRK